MLIEFKFRNYGPFRDEVLFSMAASNYDKTKFENDNVVTIPQFKLRLLKSAAIFGSNASGKSQLIAALSFFRYTVIKGIQSKNMIKEIPRFRLDDISENDPVSFNAVFLQNEKIFEYGFEAGREKINSEWLYVWISNRKSTVFFRDGNGLNKPVSKYFKVGNIIDKAKQVKEWNLYLTKAFEYEQSGNELILDVKNWFEKLRSISGNDTAGYESFICKNLHNPSLRDSLIDFIKSADFSIEDVIVKEQRKEKLLSKPESDDPGIIETYRTIQKLLESLPEITEVQVITKHKRFNKDGSYEFADFTYSEESEGTKKFIAIAGPIFDILTLGGTLLVDELDTKLHPHLVLKIIELFHSKNGNPGNAQIIFNSQNTTVFSGLRRDQIWFTKKNQFGISTLDPLSNYKNGPRKEENLEERYLDGRYGAVPFLGKFRLVSERHSLKS